jgi:hypothetical protein
LLINSQVSGLQTISANHEQRLIDLRSDVNTISGNSFFLQTEINTISADIQNSYVSGTFNNFISGAGAVFSNGILTIYHNLNSLNPDVIITDYNNNRFIADNIYIVDSNSLQVDLTSVSPLQGTWLYTVTKTGLGVGTVISGGNSIIDFLNFTSHITPVSGLYDLGSALKPWKSAYIGQSSITDISGRLQSNGKQIYLAGDLSTDSTILSISSQIVSNTSSIASISASTVPNVITLTPDVSGGLNFPGVVFSNNVYEVSANNNYTLNNPPTGSYNYTKFLLTYIQAGSGNNFLTLGNKFRQGVVGLSVSISAGQSTYLGFIYRQTLDKWDLIANQKGF